MNAPRIELFTSRTKWAILLVIVYIAFVLFLEQMVLRRQPGPCIILLP